MLLIKEFYVQIPLLNSIYIVQGEDIIIHFIYPTKVKQCLISCVSAGNIAVISIILSFY